MHPSQSRLLLATMIVGAVTLAIGTFAWSGQPPTEMSSPGFGIEVSVTPIAGVKDAFHCEAIVKELSSGTVVAHPRLDIPGGEMGKIDSLDSATGNRYTLTLKADASSATADYNLEITHDGKTLSIQQAAIHLR